MNAPHSIADYQPGIHRDVPAELYHQRVLGVVNKGALDQLTKPKTPAHYRAWLECGDEEESKALAFGRALHCAVLEPELFAASYVEPVEHPFRRPSTVQRNAKKPSQQTLEAIAYWDEWEAVNAGRTEITLLDKQTLLGMAGSIHCHPLAARLLEGGIAEATAIWNDPRQALLCKARMDYYLPERGLVVDLKSTEDASPEEFTRSVARYRYHVQHAHYASAFAATGNELRAFLFVPVEKTPPYAVAVHCIDAEAEGRGMELRDRAMDTLNRCLASDSWPAYEPRIHNLSLPVWALRD